MRGLTTEVSELESKLAARDEELRLAKEEIQRLKEIQDKMSDRLHEYNDAWPQIIEERDLLKAENERMKSGRYERGDLWNAYEKALKERDELKRKLGIADEALARISYGEIDLVDRCNREDLIMSVIDQMTEARNALAAIREGAEK